MKRLQIAAANIAVAILAAGLSGCASSPLFEGPPPIPPEQVVEMAKRGDNAGTIIGEIQKSRTVYSLTASQLVQLSRDGVPDAVLDYMQQTHLKEIERSARRDAYTDLWLSGGGWYGHPWYATPRIVYVPVRTRPPKTS